MKNAGFNTGKIKETTFLKYLEYKGRYNQALEVTGKKFALLSSATGETPLNTTKICEAFRDTASSLTTVETYGAKMNQLLTNGKLDKLPEIKKVAQKQVESASVIRINLNDLYGKKYGCQ